MSSSPSRKVESPEDIFDIISEKFSNLEELNTKH